MSGGGVEEPPVPLELIHVNFIAFTAASIDVPIPAGPTVQEGDLLVISCGHGNTVNRPAGWVDRDFKSGTNQGGRTMTRVCQAGDPGTNVTVTQTSSFAGGVTVFVLRGAAYRSMTSLRGASSTAGQVLTVAEAVAEVNDIALYHSHFRVTGSTITLGHGTTDEAGGVTNGSGKAGHETVTDAVWDQTFASSLAGSGHYVANIIVAPEADMPGPGNLRGTPTLVHVNNAATVDVPLPIGTVAGDFLVLTGAHGNTVNEPAGWTTDDFLSGVGCSGRVAHRVASATDITNGFVTVTMTSPYYGQVGLTAFPGSNWTVRDATGQRSSTGSSSVTVTSAGSAEPGDVAIHFFYARTESSVNTVIPERGTIHVQNAATNASAAVATEELEGSAGVVATVFTSPASSTAFYGCVVFVTPT